MQYAVRLYGREPEGNLYDLRDEYDLEDFANTLPMVGDCIVDPGVAGALDRRVAANRRVLQVVARYFQPLAHRDVMNPKDDDFCYVALVVDIRRGTQEEQDLVTV